MKYRDEIVRAMNLFGEQPNAVVVGQSIIYPGTPMFGTLEGVAAEKKIEVPVFEQTQLGMSIGLALEGSLPLSVFPRFNFLLVAMDQLVNHLDKIPHISQGKIMPKVLIRTMVGSVRPLDAGVQHSGNFTEALRLMLDSVVVEELIEPEMIYPAYQKAIEREDGKSTVLIEYGDYYNDK